MTDSKRQNEPCWRGRVVFTALLLGFFLCIGLGSLVWSEDAVPRVVLPEWRYSPGPLNAITDVPGVKVGQVSLNQTAPVPIHTGVTAVIPHSGNLAETGVWAAGRMINGNGALTNLDYIETTGILNSPIVLTNTFAVGQAYQGVFQFYAQKYPGETPNSTTWPGQLPVVGECYDGYFNTIEQPEAITPSHTVEALESATAGPVAQGRIGAGTGMRSFGLHAGIGSSSRQLEIAGQRYTIGVLVNANHSRLDELRPEVRQRLEEALKLPLGVIYQQDEADRVERTITLPRQGSIIIVVATDIPLLPHELDQLVTRASLGIGAMGSTINTTSGDGVIVFSTAAPIPVGEAHPEKIQFSAVHPDNLSPVYRATVEAVTEAQINALLYAHKTP